MASITFEIKHEIATLTLNRPEVHNALNWEAMRSFAKTVDCAANHSEIRALILTGAGRTFCAGGDLFELHHYPSREDGLKLATLMGEALDQLENLPFPTLAAIEGAALGGGAEIALACDLRVMAADAKLALTQVRLALSPAWGTFRRLMHLIGYAKAMEWLAMGVEIKASEAARFGIAAKITPDGKSLTQARAYARAFAAADPNTIRTIKALLLAYKIPGMKRTRPERNAFAELWSSPAHHQASSRFIARKSDEP
jgi:enoyl-CoA hydratase